MSTLAGPFQNQHWKQIGPAVKVNMFGTVCAPAVAPAFKSTLSQGKAKTFFIYARTQARSGRPVTKFTKRRIRERQRYEESKSLAKVEAAILDGGLGSAKVYRQQQPPTN
jgi:hypothetical protein